MIWVPVCLLLLFSIGGIPADQHIDRKRLRKAKFNVWIQIKQVKNDS